jgi:hypothetical protein
MTNKKEVNEQDIDKFIAIGRAPMLLKAVLEVLIEKNVITRAELREKMEKIKDNEELIFHDDNMVKHSGSGDDIGNYDSPSHYEYNFNTGEATGGGSDASIGAEVSGSNSNSA